jgi:hypothetical protein
MFMSDAPPQPSAAQPPRWQPLPALARRVVGVLVEKAKTTPDAYPMSLNALVAGCNQKSNRYPLLNVEADQVEDAINHLRNVGAVAVVQGGGRVERFRHYMYEWLGVDKTELAVMTELLLRGAQTEGELRGRAARMEPIADLPALRPVLESLKAKKLVISLTPEGRGHVVTHNLYEPRELEKLRAQFAAAAHMPPGDEGEDDRQAPVSASPSTAATASARPAAAFASSTTTAAPAARAASGEMESLKQELAELRRELDQLAAAFRECRSEIDRLKEQWGA